MNKIPAHTSASDIARRVTRREISPVEVAEDALARVEDQNRNLNAFISLRSDQALEEARVLQDRISANEEVGPLAGVPIGIKDVEDVAGMPTTYGSIPFKDNVASRDSAHVSRLRSAGAIIIGKTNTPEFASLGFTRNLLFGVTGSPWNPQLTPGGSSGGSAAAVVAGIVPLATGTDRGGSIRIPASYTGCFGMKPTYGRVPRGPTTMLDWSDLESIGPLTGSVLDAALYLDAVAGHHPLDPDSLRAGAGHFESCLKDPPAKLRIAWAPAFSRSRCDPDVMKVVRSAATAFAELGHDLDETSVELPGTLNSDWRAIGAFERYAALHGLIEPRREDFGRAFLRGVESGRNVGAERYGMAQRTRAELNRRFASLFENYDLLLTPATPTTAFGARGPLPTEIAGVQVKDPLEVTPFTHPFNMSGHPAASVPAGLVNGLPVGLQIVAPRHKDDLVLQVSYAYEQARPWLDSWPEL